MSAFSLAGAVVADMQQVDDFSLFSVLIFKLDLQTV